ncbi:MAG: SseB family protein [Actinomycetales bacterium]|nr:SseB family protein [Actinomycetales bacterium]
MRGRSLPPAPLFAGDDGSTDPHLAAALATVDDGARLVAVVRALPMSRVLVPVVAYLEERAEVIEHHGQRIAGEKSASAAMVTVATPDGREAVPVFSGMDSLRAWRVDARPIPAEGVRAALAAVSDADGLLVLDPAGPVTVLVPRPAVWAIGQQREWVPSPQDPEVATAVGRALGSVSSVTGVRVEPGERAELRVILSIVPGLGRDALDAVLAAAGEALAADPVVGERVDSVELSVVAGAPGR